MLTQDDLQKIDGLFGKRFDSVDKRFNSVDKQFDTVGKRLDSFDKKFDSIDRRFGTLTKRIENIELTVGSTQKEMLVMSREILGLKQRLDEHEDLLVKVRAGIRDMHRDIKTIVNFFDRGYLELHQRIRNVEVDLGIPTTLA